MIFFNKKLQNWLNLNKNVVQICFALFLWSDGIN